MFNPKKPSYFIYGGKIVREFRRIIKALEFLHKMNSKGIFLNLKIVDWEDI